MDKTENELIEYFKRFEKKSAVVKRGIGDDGAVIELSSGSYVLVQDGLAEHVHFEFAFMTPYSLGKKSLYVNISDVLSMGALPLFFMVTMGIPARLSSKEIRGIYRGIGAAAREFNVLLVGGDTTETKNDLFIDVSMIGKLIREDYLGRNKAKTGDLIGVTGYLGESAYGLHLLKEGMRFSDSNRFVRRYREPRPPYPVWKELIEQEIPNAMMDISDGLIIDLERLTMESRKSAVINIEQIPIPSVLKRENRHDLALSGGEDFQFLFTFPPEKLPALEALMLKKLPVSVVGAIGKGRGVKVLKNGKEVGTNMKGYEHFGEHR